MTTAARPAVAALVSFAIALVWPHVLTDGDSCLYAAMAHDMAKGGSFVAPTWDFHGAPGFFREHPPGGLWAAAIAERCGAPFDRAALAANAVFLVAAAAGVVALARRFTSDAAAAAAGLAFLLHLPVMRYVQRAGLEIPFAAGAVWTLAGALRMERHRAWIAVTAAALAFAFLVRGVFALVPAALVAGACLDRGLAVPWRRAGVALAGAAALLVVFDRLHAAATGTGFWSAYLARQVMPSIGEGGGSHAREGETFTYYAGRALVYTLPFSLVPLWRIVRGPRPPVFPAAWRLAAAWIVLTVAGASMSNREGSRYLFQIYVASALLVALACPPTLGPRFAKVTWALLLVAVPAGVLLKPVFAERDAWRATAEALDAARGAPWIAGRTIHGPFQPEDDRLKALLRFHLGGADVSSSPEAPPGALVWVRPGDPAPTGRVLVATPLGVLAER